jgi:hypothetical protein
MPPAEGRLQQDVHTDGRSALVAVHSTRDPAALGARVDAAAASSAPSGASVARPPVSASQVEVHVAVRFGVGGQVAPHGAGGVDRAGFRAGV